LAKFIRTTNGIVSGTTIETIGITATDAVRTSSPQ
jgi:hypothetical protein